MTGRGRGQSAAASNQGDADVADATMQGIAPPLARSADAIMPKPRLAPLPHLGKNNFRPWKIVLRAHLACFGLAHLMDKDKQDSVTAHEFAQAKSYIIGTLGESDYQHMENSETFYDLVEALRTARHGRVEQYQVELASKLLSFRIQPNESITDFCDQMRTTCEQLNDSGVAFTDLLLSVWTLTCARLDSRYTTQCDIMLGLGVKLTMDHVQSALKAVEEKGSSNVPSATGLVSRVNVSVGKGKKRVHAVRNQSPYKQ